VGEFHFLVLGKETLGSVSLEWRSGGDRKTNQRENRGGKRESFRRSTCVLLRVSGRAHSLGSRNRTGWKQKKKRMGERR